MLELIEYIETQDGICVYRCYGEGSFLELPDMVDGSPVTSLADHVFAAEPSHKLRNVPKKQAALWQEDSLKGKGWSTGGFSGLKKGPDMSNKGPAVINEGLCISKEEPAGQAEQFAFREGCRPMAAESLEVIVLPGTLRQIGDYAFYGCRNLKSVTMSALLEKLGGGAFVAANHVRELVFVAEEGLTDTRVSDETVCKPVNRSLLSMEEDCFIQHGVEEPVSMRMSDQKQDLKKAGSDCLFPKLKDTAQREDEQTWVLPPVPALRHVLGEIAYEVETRITDGDGDDILRLHFPEFYEDAVENTPARIFEMKFEGTGYKYRQCFKGEVPDLARYDSLFYEASVQEFTPTVMMILCDRLLYPYQLGPEAKETYLSYLRENIDRFAAWCFGGGLDGASRTGPDTMELMQCLCRETYPDGQPFFDRDSLQVCLVMARERGHADVAGFLEDYRRKHFTRPSARERYMLG